jgi:uncharacterized pyridoxamine 5'-phosphate oxidase family protein
MASLNMKGPYDFTAKEIDKWVDAEKIGNYALGHMKEDTFIVNYVGRSDIDVNAELKKRLTSKYPKFKFSYASSAKDAFERECHNYHDFGGKEKLDNENHPDRPDGTSLPCPVPGCTELED